MKLIMNRILLLFLMALPYGCGVYSFTGASISPDIKTISIQTFFNNAPLGPSNMSVLFTERIKDYFQQNTSLELVDNDGDLQMDGYIADYTITPVGATGGGGANATNLSPQTRITITVFATYFNTQDDTFDFEKRFSFWQDVDESEDINAIEQEIVEIIFDQLVIDIFNASVANW